MHVGGDPVDAVGNPCSLGVVFQLAQVLRAEIDGRDMASRQGLSQSHGLPAWAAANIQNRQSLG